MNRIYVANLPTTITPPVLQTAFAPFGNIAKIFVATDRDTGVPRGYGFVTYDHSEDAASAIAGMNGTELEGSVLAVSVAREPAPLPVRRVAPPPPRRFGPGSKTGPARGPSRR